MVKSGVTPGPSPEWLAEYKAGPPPSGVSYATPFVIVIRGDKARLMRLVARPAVVRRTPSNGRPASSSSRRRIASRGSQGDKPTTLRYRGRSPRLTGEPSSNASTGRVACSAPDTRTGAVALAVEPEEFSNGSTYCKSCEAARIAERRRRGDGVRYGLAEQASIIVEGAA